MPDLMKIRQSLDVPSPLHLCIQNDIGIK